MSKTFERSILMPGCPIHGAAMSGIIRAHLTVRWRAEQTARYPERPASQFYVGGKNISGHMSGIHGAHLGRIEYIATDRAKQTIPWVASVNNDGVTTEYLASDVKTPAGGQRRVMDCIDCHNRPAHSFETPEGAVNRAMAQGRLSLSLPFVHKEGTALIKAQYASEQDARAKIENGLAEFYRARYPDIWNRKRAEVDQAAKALNEIYEQNVSPSMEVTWGTHPNNISHNDYPGCFRCHDGSHQTKNGKTLTNDCTACHNLLAVDEVKPSNSLIWDCSKRGIDCELVAPQ